MLDEMVTAWRRASTAELVWTAPHGAHGTPIVPLVWPEDHAPCAAVPLSRLDEVESIAGQATLSVHTSDPISRTLVASGRVDVRLDLTGEEFVEHLLAQEAVKHPPTRLRADSIMARRENWWWLPRVLITLTGPAQVRELPARTDAQDALLVRQHTDPSGRDEAPFLTVVTAAGWPKPGEADRIELWPRCGAALGGSGESGFVFGHRHSPDFERWERWYRNGTLRDDVLHVGVGDGAPQPGDEHAGTAEPFTLLERLANHRRTAKSCKAGIAKAEKRRS